MARTEASYWTGLTFVCFCFLLQQLKLKLKLMLNAFSSSYLEEVKLTGAGCCSCSTTTILVNFFVYFLKGKQHFDSFVELKAFSAFCCCSC